MKSSKLLLSVIALAAFAAAPVLRAEDDKPAPAAAGASEHKGPHGDRLKALTEQLGLTDAQVAQIHPILQDEKAALKALEAEPASDAKKAKAKEIRESHKAQILAILTPEQQAKFKEGHDKRK